MSEEKLAERQYLLTGLLDGELNPAETARANDLLIRDAAFRAEYEALRQACDRIADLDFALPHERELDKLWQNPYRRWSRRLGFLLVGAGCLLLLGFALWQFLLQGSWDLPTVATLTVWFGLLILFLSTLFERLKSRKTDPYQEVER